MNISRRQLAPFLERISYGLGQRYHYFDEIYWCLADVMQSTESPILFRSCRESCGHETQFYDQKGASKIEDSVL
jgi:hypothetical protein